MKKKIVKKIIDNVEQCLLEELEVTKKLEENNRTLQKNLEEISRNTKKE